MALQKIPSRQLDLGPAQYFEPYQEEPAGNQIAIRSGWIKTSTSKVRVPAQNTVAFLPVSAVNRVRWDIVYVDPSGIVHVDAGIEQLNTAPEFTGAQAPPAYSYPLAYVRITETAAVVVTTDDITDIRPQANTQEDREYSPNYVVMDGANYNEAISALDNEADVERNFTGRNDDAQLLPTYDDKGAPLYSVANADQLAHAIAKIDIELNRLKGWLGKTNLAETLPNYAPQTTGHSIGLNDLAKVAIGKLDQALFDLVHNATNSKQGGDGLNQFYHVAQTIFAALIAHGGYIPSAANPFGTVGEMAAQVAAARVVAWGEVGNFGPSGGTHTYANVNLTAGTNDNGSYNGISGAAFGTSRNNVAIVVAHKGGNGVYHMTEWGWGSDVPLAFYIDQYLNGTIHEGSTWLAIRVL